MSIRRWYGSKVAHQDGDLAEAVAALQQRLDLPCDRGHFGGEVGGFEKPRAESDASFVPSPGTPGEG